MTRKQDARFAYICPRFNQAKDVAWLYVKRLTADIPGVQLHESELRADFPNGARVRLYGADNPDRLRGIYLDGCILDEFADMRPSVWGEIIRPMLMDRKGWAAFLGTPKGRNAFYTIYERARTDPEWFTLLLNAAESGLLPQKRSRQPAAS
jgi:phage terminase large subunit